MAWFEALLCDRDGTLIVNVPYNGDWRRVRPIRGVAEALRHARDAGLRTAIVTNQSGLAAGHFTAVELDAVHRHVDALLGPFDAILHCPHAPDADCRCRKPSPGMVEDAAARVGTTAARCAVVGDTAADVAAADSAGAVGVLVPTTATRQDEIDDAARRGRLRSTLLEVVDDVIAGRLDPVGVRSGE